MSDIEERLKSLENSRTRFENFMGHMLSLNQGIDFEGMDPKQAVQKLIDFLVAYKEILGGGHSYVENLDNVLEELERISTLL